jgi:cytochrome P450
LTTRRLLLSRPATPSIRVTLGAASLFRHEDIVNVLADPEAYSSASKRCAVPNVMDPPAHTRYSRALAPYFRPEQMNAREPDCRRIAVDLANDLPRRHIYPSNGFGELPVRLR